MSIVYFSPILPDQMLDIQHSVYDPFSSMKTMHYHDCYEIYCQTSGDRNILVGEKLMPIRQGDVVWINKFDLHQSLQGNQPRGTRTVLYFTEEYLKDTFGKDTDSLLSSFSGAFQFLHLDEKKQKKEMELLEEIEHAVRARRMLYARFVFGQFLLLLQQWSEQALPMPRTPERVNPTYNRIAGVLSYLKNHFCEKIRLTEVAELFYVSPSYLSRTFKECTGISFIDYVNHLRIEKAKSLLRAGNGVTAISMELGYENVTHFERVFKKLTGAAPLQWRSRQTDRG